MFLAGAAGPRWDCRDSGLRGGLMNLEERGMDQGTLRQRADCGGWEQEKGGEVR